MWGVANRREVVPNRKQIIIISVLGLLALMLGYWTGSLTRGQVSGSDKELILEDKVVGEYEEKVGEGTIKLVFLDNGIMELYINGREKEYKEAKWSVVKGEIHATDSDGDILVFRINTKSSLGISSVSSITNIAEIEEGKRKDIAIKNQFTFKRIK